MNYMLQNSSRVIKTEGWKNLLQSSPEIANAIVSNLSKYRDEHAPSAGTSNSGNSAGEGPSGGHWLHFGAPVNPEDEEIPRYYVGHNQFPHFEDDGSEHGYL